MSFFGQFSEIYRGSQRVNNIENLFKGPRRREVICV